MRRSFLAVFILAAAACVDVPDSIRAQFAAPGAADRSNYRLGAHGSAPPVEEPPAEKAAATAITGDTSGSAVPSSASDADGGAPSADPAGSAAADGGAS